MVCLKENARQKIIAKGFKTQIFVGKNVV